MAEKKKATGAGPYSGYSKNYQPVKSSKGTAAENLVQKGLRAVAKDGSKTVRVKGPDGKMRTVQVQEAGGLGKIVSSVAKNLLPKAGKPKPKMSTPAKKDSPEPKKLYHGTASPLKKGDTLTPGSGATTHYKFAESYSKGRGSIAPKGLPKPKPSVVEVKPSGKGTAKVARAKEDGKPKWQKPGKNEYNDKGGFRVVGEAKKPKPSKPKMKATETKRRTKGK